MSEIKLEKCRSICLKPDSTDFYELNDHENLLSMALPNFSAIVAGQWLCLTVS